jgi:glycosyltransferase involved in cell wall biosynthesis
VAFRVGGLAESVVDGETGLLADTYEGFVTAIRRVLGSPALRDALGAAARERSAGFTWEATAAEFLRILGDEQVVLELDGVIAFEMKPEVV